METTTTIETKPTTTRDRVRTMGRDGVIAAIRTALKTRTGKSWSVTGGRGTAWGWIRIDAPPARRTADFEGNTLPVNDRVGGCSTREDRDTLAKALGLERIHPQGESIPSGGDYYAEYLDRAEGRKPEVTGTPYWD